MIGATASTPMPTKRGAAGLRVLVVSQYGHTSTGGAERYIHEVCARLSANHGFQVHLAATDGDPDLPLALSPARFRLWSAGFNPAWNSELRRLVAAWRPGVMYVHHTVPGVTDVALRVARALGIPAEVMYHSDVTGADLPRRVVGDVYQQLIGRGSLAAARRVHVASQAYLDASPVLRSARLPVTFAPPGVDPVMAEGRAGTHPPFLLFVGKADVPSKGFSVLLAAWQRLRSRWPQLELLVVGSGQPQTDLPGLRWAGAVSSRRALADLYASARVTVLPSASSAESFGMVLAEALVAGCPVVASRIGGLPALVEEGVTGFLAEPGNIQSLEHALDQALVGNLDLRQNIAAQRTALLQRFSWDDTTAVVAGALSGSVPVGAVPIPSIGASTKTSTQRNTARRRAPALSRRAEPGGTP